MDICFFLVNITIYLARCYVQIILIKYKMKHTIKIFYFYHMNNKWIDVKEIEVYLSNLMLIILLSMWNGHQFYKE